MLLVFLVSLPIGYFKFYFRFCAETVVVTPFFISYQTKTLRAQDFSYFRSADFGCKLLSWYYKYSKYNCYGNTVIKPVKLFLLQKVCKNVSDKKYVRSL